MKKTDSKIKFTDKSDYRDATRHINEVTSEYNWTQVEPQIVRYGIRTSGVKSAAVAGVMAFSSFGDLVAKDYIKNPEFNLDDVASFAENFDKSENQYFEEIKTVSSLNKIREKNDLIKDIISFKVLNNNWDGYGALPAEIESATNAITLVHYLEEEIADFISDLFPNPNGTISFLWKNNSEERLSLEVGNQTMSYYLKLNSQKPQFFNNKNINKKNITELSGLVKML
ncbi:MAG: hypothetical protein R6V32_04215 [Bacteroidales bacterium]